MQDLDPVLPYTRSKELKVQLSAVMNVFQRLQGQTVIWRYSNSSFCLFRAVSEIDTDHSYRGPQASIAWLCMQYDMSDLAYLWSHTTALPWFRWDWHQIKELKLSIQAGTQAKSQFNDMKSQLSHQWMAIRRSDQDLNVRDRALRRILTGCRIRSACRRYCRFETRAPIGPNQPQHPHFSDFAWPSLSANLHGPHFSSSRLANLTCLRSTQSGASRRPPNPRQSTPSRPR